MCVYFNQRDATHVLLCSYFVHESYVLGAVTLVACSSESLTVDPWCVVWCGRQGDEEGSGGPALHQHGHRKGQASAKGRGALQPRETEEAENQGGLKLNQPTSQYHPCLVDKALRVCSSRERSSFLRRIEYWALKNSSMFISLL